MTHATRTLFAAVLLAGLAGCSSLVGGPVATPTIYSPEPSTTADPAWPTVAWQLGTVRPTAPKILDGTRIAVSPVPGELQVYKAAMWARTPAEMLEDTVLRTLEDSGNIPAIARQGSGIGAQFRLVMDIRHFESDYRGGATPSAVIEVNAKLLHVPDQVVAGNRTFRLSQPAAGTDVGRVAEAFGQALGDIGRDIAGWTLVTGQAHQQQAHR